MLNRLFPHMYDSPERNQTLAGLTYGVVPFLLLPVSLTLLVFGVSATRPYVILEYFYQIVNIIAVFVIFRSYFQDSWLNVSLYPKKFWAVCLGAAFGICCIYGGYVVSGMMGLLPQGNLAVLGTMPMAGVELMLLPGDFILLDGGIVAAIFLTLLGPVITAGLFYATAFAPLCVAGHRFGAYIGVAALTALPRLITASTFWGGWKEGLLYLTQLPIHLIACWTYQKTDSVWAPIFTLAIGNAFACVTLFVLHYIGILV